ncbi:hypothetical protein KIN20_001787 [Parelaphostrongylus tenuis]|uniref:Uncharacterized protein n=1 Tax=Parelaphostrongylus tenuis TaxID=148309 RepID=A0AAD5MD93_PARTN|nr:hypothetical protein KIN20_001787 [Parelaphostrongylus tenuis]
MNNRQISVTIGGMMRWKRQSHFCKVSDSNGEMFKLQKRELEGVAHVGFTLVCGAKLKSTLWRISANVKLVIREKDGEHSVDRSYPGNEFTFAAKALADMISWEEIKTLVGCGNRDDTKSPIVLTFELQVDVTRSYGFRRRAQFEYSFSEPSVETDMVLLIENRKLYVNSTTETIANVSMEDFVELLNVVYPSQRPVTGDLH